MQRFIIALIIVILSAAIYMFLQPDTSTPAPRPDQPPEVSEQTRSEAQAHIESLTRQASSDVIEMDNARHFVTGEQLLSLPAREAIKAEQEALDEDGNASSFAVDMPARSTDNAGQPAPELALDRLRLQELLQDPDRSANEVFYIHSVQPVDRHGLWGILRQGLIETFARGIRVNERSRVLSVAIPEDADTLLEDRRSSWLGRLLHDKVEQTWVYNHQQGLLGQNPDVIHPGQQLVIVRFSEDELISIYNHFSESTR
ncbi:hypothetical protein [Marinobacterium sp. MBR-109]|jgi:hypothetical protein|uniref:hypothetical protein n=1 Tax=Marinobacterium sp. MBR-109 TaxID=3156462 RepID=UPI00339761F2